MGWRRDILVFEKDGNRIELFIYVSTPSNVPIKWKTEDPEVIRILRENLHKRLVRYSYNYKKGQYIITGDGVKEGFSWDDIFEVLEVHHYRFRECLRGGKKS